MSLERIGRKKADNGTYRDIFSAKEIRSLLYYQNAGKNIVLSDNEKHLEKFYAIENAYEVINKAVLSVIADIAKRLSMANPDSQNPLEEDAVILIDELDLHLHPKWQKEIVDDLKRTFPNCQFIVSTHSPFVIQSLNAEELFDIKTMQYAGEEGSYKGWSIEAIQEHKMGVEPKTAIFNQYLEEFSSAMDDENYEKAKTLYKELKEMVSPGSHESKILKLDMEMIEADDKA